MKPLIVWTMFLVSGSGLAWVINKIQEAMQLFEMIVNVMIYSL